MALIVVTVLAIVVGIIAVRVTIRFDLNAWLRDRREAKILKSKMKLAKQCDHMWTLYHASPYSRCNLCLAYIATTTLLVFQDDPRVSIAGESWNHMFRTVAGGVIAQSPAGHRRK